MSDIEKIQACHAKEAIDIFIAKQKEKKEIVIDITDRVYIGNPGKGSFSSAPEKPREFPYPEDNDIHAYLQWSKTSQVYTCKLDEHTQKIWFVTEKIHLSRFNGAIQKEYHSYYQFYATETGHDICIYCGYDNNNGREGWDCISCGGN